MTDGEKKDYLLGVLQYKYALPELNKNTLFQIRRLNFRQLYGKEKKWVGEGSTGTSKPS